MRRERISGVVWTMVGLVGTVAFAQKTAAPVKGAAAPLPGVWAKLDETLDTGYTKAGDKISASLQSEVDLNGTKLPKGTKLTGTVVKTAKQDKQHPNSGLVLRFDTAALKGGSTVPVHVAIASLAPSHADEVEKVDVGSGDVTDASLSADVAAGEMNDPNGHTTAGTGTRVNGVRASSSINGVVLFASPDGSTSGVIVAKKGPLELEKWTRMSVVVTTPEK